MGWGGMISGLVESNSDAYTNVDGTVTTKKNISQEGIDKIIYDILSSDSGLAALSSGENGSGGFGSSTKGLMAQDLMVKLAGEIANITAETTQTTQTKQQVDKQSPMGKALGTIICTELWAQGRLHRRNYARSKDDFHNLPARTITGYNFWAEPVVELMKKSRMLSRFWAFVMNGRYETVVTGKITFGFLLTKYILEPISYTIGFLLGVQDGRYA